MPSREPPRAHPTAKQERDRRHDAHRRATKPWRKLYATARWQALRSSQLAKQPLCERCLAGKPRCITVATIVHHKRKHEGNEALFFDPLNLASSCQPCHDIDEQRIERGGQARQTIGTDGWPVT